MRYGFKGVVYGVSCDVLVIVLAGIGHCGGGDVIIFTIGVFGSVCIVLLSCCELPVGVVYFFCSLYLY